MQVVMKERQREKTKEREENETTNENQTTAKERQYFSLVWQITAKWMETEKKPKGVVISHCN